MAKPYVRTKPQHLALPATQAVAASCFLADLLDGTISAVSSTVVLDEGGAFLRIEYEEPAPPEEDDVIPVGGIYESVVDTDPGLPKPDGFGYGTWARLGNGRLLVGVDEGDEDFEEPELTGGAKTVTPAGTNSGAAVANHASHTHSYTEIVQHTHSVTITDGGHTHVQNAHNHTQDPHSHGMAEGQTDGAGVFADRSSAASAAAMVTDAATATNQATTAVNQSATTGITASSSNPAGSVASGTTGGPSATLTHSVTQPTFTGEAHTNMPPFLAVYRWVRTA